MGPRDRSNPQTPDRVSSLVGLPLRLFLGVTFLYAGVQKLLDPHFFDANAPGFIGRQLTGYVRSGSPLSPIITHVALPHAALIGAIVALTEIWIGCSAVTGLLTRVGALGGLLLSLTFYLTASWTVHPFFLGPDLPYAVAWLTLCLSGPGPGSLDARLFAPHPRAAQRTNRDNRSGTAANWSIPRGAMAIGAGAPPRLTRALFLRGIGASVVLAAFSAAIGAAARRQPGSSSAMAADASTKSTTPEPALAIKADPTAGGARSSAIEPTKGSAPTSGSAPTTQPIGAIAPNAGTTASGAASDPAGRVTATSVDTREAEADHAKPIPSPTVAPPTRTPVVEKAKAGAVLLGNIASVPKNRAGRYADPSSGDPALLVHLPDGTFVAFDAVCTHAGCTVEYDPSQRLMVCPCHGATFDPAQAGQVLSGPTDQPLPALKVQILGNGDVYALKAN